MRWLPSIIRRTAIIRVGAGVLLLLVAHLGLLWTFDLAARPLLALVWITVAVGALVLLSLRGLRMNLQGSMLILSVAALLRLCLLPLPPTLSDDVYRYVWDGRVISAGFNPYQLAPEDAELEPLRDDLWRRLPHRDVATVYPPFAMGLFSIAANLPSPVYALKGMLAAIDLGACALLLVLARRYGKPEWCVIWYAWNPLVTLEIAGMGHVDAFGVAAVLATLLVLSWGKRGSLRAGVAAAVAVLVKLIPVAAMPVWIRAAVGRKRFIAGAGLVLLVVGLPVLIASGLPSGVVTYGVSWEYNGPIYEPLWRVLDGLGVSEGIEGLLDGLKSRFGRHDTWNLFYPYNYPQFLARILLALGLATAIVVLSRKGEPFAATGRIFGAMILASATVYPWYLIWILPWAALERRVAWLTLAALSPLSYLPQVSNLELFPWLYLAMWGPFVILLPLERRWSTA